MPPSPGPLELGGRAEGVAEVDDGHAVQAVSMVGELLGQEVVATRCAQRSVVGDMLDPDEAVGTGVHQTMVDPDPVHPADPLGDRRGVRRMQDDRPSVLLCSAHQAREQCPPIRPTLIGQRPQQVTGDGPRQCLNSAGNLIEPRSERVILRREVVNFPVGVDINDGHPVPPSLPLPDETTAGPERCRGRQRGAALWPK
jgi:hypothetical protein